MQLRITRHKLFMYTAGHFFLISRLGVTAWRRTYDQVIASSTRGRGYYSDWWLTTKVNSAFHSSGVAILSTGLPGWD